MLRLSTKTPLDGGFYVTGRYTLAVVAVEEGVLRLDRTEAEYTFTPNPTDLDDTTMFANTVSPDQGGGFYVELSEIGTKTISIRGTTGQFPAQSQGGRILESIAGATGRLAASTANLLGITDREDGYSEFIKLQNFFREWGARIRSDPSRYAMVFVNHKDVDFYQVVPIDFRKTRTSARPLQYGYAVSLRVISEFDPSGVFARQQSWLDRVDNIRSQINRWRQAINQAALLSSYLVSSSLSTFTATSLAPFSDMTAFFDNLAEGIQGAAFVANSSTIAAATSVEQLNDATARLFTTREGSVIAETRQMIASTNVSASVYPAASSSSFVPPTSSAMARIFAANTDVLWAAEEILNASLTTSAGMFIYSGIDTNSPYIDQYITALELNINGLIATEAAPLPEWSPSGRAGADSRAMHEAARAGLAGYVADSTSDLVSASLAEETQIIDGVRQPRDRTNDTSARYSLAYIAALVLGPWARGNDESISPELNSFRRGFLGMRDPSTLAPLYKIVDVSSTDTIYSLASRHLGSWRRWFEIALINDLKYPYVSTAGGEFVRKPGEQVYIPLETATVPVSLVERLLSITSVHDLVSLQDAFLGFDLELDYSGDMVFNGRDYAFVSGVKAFEQELSMVLDGAGGVTSDPTQGLGLRIGSKGKGGATAQLWGGYLRRWLSADPRVNDVVALKTFLDGDTVHFYTKLRFENYDSTVTVAGDVRPR